MLRPAFVIVFSFALTGCIFLVDSLPDGTSTTCNLTTPPFTDGTNACKTCITDSCQHLLDVCCGDSTCQAQLSNVDSCANEDGCSALASAAGTEGPTSDLIACIAGNCGKDCYGIDAGPATDSSSSSCGSSCAPTCNFNSDDSECTCSVLQNSTGVTSVCPASKFSASVCCASPGYAVTLGSTCACENIYCEDNGDFCSCELGVTGSGGSTSCFPSGGASQCCLSADRSSCTCDPNDACDQQGETSVDDCTTENWSCPATGARTQSVSSCAE